MHLPIFETRCKLKQIYSIDSNESIEIVHVNLNSMRYYFCAAILIKRFVFVIATKYCTNRFNMGTIFFWFFLLKSSFSTKRCSRSNVREKVIYVAGTICWFILNVACNISIIWKIWKWKTYSLYTLHTIKSNWIYQMLNMP